MKFDLVTPQKQLASLQADYVEIPGAEGDFGVLDGHQPTLSSLRPGALVVRNGEEETTYCVGFGFVDVGAHSVTVLAEEAVKVSDIDVDTVGESLKEAEASLEGADDAAEKSKAEKRIACLAAQLALVTEDVTTDA